ncbi:MAG: hypothetical protein NTX50_12085 [Candidatus Sumerlaeota bacterium]|nr:hypothetical protein [Candidatus Sumerlaeota bacterium]
MEMAIVIVIMGLMLVVSIPTLRSVYSMNKIETSARDLASVFRAARAQAVFDNRTITVRMDFVKGEYQLDLMLSDKERLERHDRGAKVKPAIERVRRLADEVNFGDVLIWDEQISRTEKGIMVTLEFYPNGTATPAIIILEEKEKGRDDSKEGIKLKTRTVEKRTVTVSRSTGQTRIINGEPADMTLAGQTSSMKRTVKVLEE